MWPCLLPSLIDRGWARLRLQAMNPTLWSPFVFYGLIHLGPSKWVKLSPDLYIIAHFDLIV